MEENAGDFWGLITIIGPVLLGAVLIWALLRNRKTTPREDAHTEQATHDLYEQIDREDKAREDEPSR